MPPGEEYVEYRSPSRSPAQPQHSHAAVAAAEQRVHAIQEAALQMAPEQPAVGGFAWVGSSSGQRRHTSAGGAPVNRAHSHVHGHSPAHSDGAGASSDASPLPTKLVATSVMASSSRSANGASTSGVPYHGTHLPTSPLGQHANLARERSPSPAAMDPPPPRDPASVQAQKPPLVSRKRPYLNHPPVNAQFKRPSRQ
jgi:hypothetical protein